MTERYDPLTKGEVADLVKTLCVDFGFCLTVEAAKELETNPPRTVDAFTKAVFVADGEDPAVAGERFYSQVERFVAASFERAPERTGRQGPTAVNVIDHTGIGVADVALSGAFYDAALGALGMRRAMQMPDGEGSDGIGYGFAYPVFWIDRFHPHSCRQHTAFAARSRADVDAFHTAALGAGGKDNGAPGERQNQSTPGYYAAFVLDPDGNNIEAVFRG